MPGIRIHIGKTKGEPRTAIFFDFMGIFPNKWQKSSNFSSGSNVSFREILDLSVEFFRTEFYRIYRIYRICRRLFLVLVIFIFKTTKNSYKFYSVFYRIPFGKTRILCILLLSKRTVTNCGHSDITYLISFSEQQFYQGFAPSGRL